MRIVNFDPVTVGAAISTIVTAAQANAATSAGLEQVAINPSIAIVIVDPSTGNNWANIPSAVPGTAANSPFVCAANVVTMVSHRGGAIAGITTGADSTVKFAFAVDQ